MPQRDNTFPDDVPIADAAEQLRSATDPTEADEYEVEPGELPLETSPADWQEQQETVVIDDELESSD
ncbi:MULTISPECIES: hypothetical protein [Mycobacterium]|jgi:hypothetical protein|uniref:Uncharacterized protein n=1 Tax=Mycobacterium gordonae TaxID=1778 RepID=A0A1A6B7Q6_MYCGO|nr:MULTISPECIES: hypothetical protein [Mycobacterium]MBI2697680.1 hypothetical protein [Mycobacterium sp.]MBX9982892.1 hypothetical protein [Mycobacterium gordonae]MCQ4360126.1 hypothetical protein [Mycobacterium gordonae]MCV7004858.1 hypothetical protein [Mycobacterium gordonae]OBR98376.1 hypothetical protein A9W98_03015 [Mycobacterium gordonae]